MFFICVEEREWNHLSAVVTMSATVEIVIEEIKDTIAIPFSALIERDDKTFARVLAYGRVVEREIETGPSVGSKVVVTDGLSEGDVVCLR